MVNLTLKFVAFARGSGLRISTSEVLDCLNHLALVDVLDQEQFAMTLRTNFVKTYRDQPAFDRLFRLFFHELRDADTSKHAGTLNGHIEEALAAMQQQMQPGGLPQPIRDFLLDDPLGYLQALQAGRAEQMGPGQALGGNMGGLVNRLAIMLALDNARSAMARYLSENRNSIPWEIREDLNAYFTARLRNARDLLFENQPAVGAGVQTRISQDQRLNQLSGKAFQALTPKEMQELREVIRKLAAKLKDTLNRRNAKRSRGMLDFKKTVRRSAQYYGLPMEVVYKKRIPHKSKLVVLCDVSGSVWSAARFMLNMLYSLQECFTKVRSFIFVSDLTEITAIFERYEADTAMDKVLSEADIDYQAATNYGRMLRLFQDQYLETLNKKTTVIIIGDARSNYQDPEEGILKEIREKSRRLIWLNPETKQFWYSGDSEAATYQPYCHEFRLCQNLDQLHDFIKELVL